MGCRILKEMTLFLLQGADEPYQRLALEFFIPISYIL